MRPMSTTAAALLDLVLHEMRTPITVATGSLRQVGPLGEATAQAAIDRALRSCARLDQLASQMRDWVRTIETPPATEVQAVDDLVRTAVTRAKANRTPDPAVQIDQGPPVKAAGAPALADALASLIEADIEQFAGQPGAAVAILRRGYAEAERMGAMSLTATMAAFLADALSQDGAHDEADEAASFSEEQAPESDIVTQVLWRTAKSRALSDGQRAEAEKLARHAVGLARKTDYPDLKARSFACLGQVVGPGDEQASLFAEAREAWEQKGNVAAVPRLPIGSVQSA